MYTLYYSPGACSMAVHVILNTLNVPFKAVRTSIKDGDTKKPEFLKKNPRGAVPFLEFDGHGMREGGAIITYLCDAHSSPLLPKSGWARANALQWLMFANATLHVAYSKAGMIGRTVDDGPSKEKALKAALDSIQSMWDEIETHLAANGPYLCGKEQTAADILLTVIANWSWLPRQFSFGPKTKTLLKTISAQPAYQKALQEEQVEYKAAA
ncbi:MAG: glutathione S-transferase family protein [Alphaproteobacteria bacterium]|nr:glutathione S-transferase family protein [Alphaproteobacteria bacterium]